MYKYTCTGNVNIKTPGVDNFNDIKIDIKQFPDHIESHYEYPNGLVLDIIQYPTKFEYISNKKIVVLEDFSLSFDV